MADQVGLAEGLVIAAAIRVAPLAPSLDGSGGIRKAADQAGQARIGCSKDGSL